MPSTIKGGTTLIASPCLNRLQANLHDLIIIAYEAYTKAPGNLLRLDKLVYVSGERLEDKYCMHFEGLVKDLAQHGITTVHLTFTASVGRAEL